MCAGRGKIDWPVTLPHYVPGVFNAVSRLRVRVYSTRGKRRESSWQQKRSVLRFGSARLGAEKYMRSSSSFLLPGTFFLLTQPGTGHKKVERRSGRKWSSLLHTAISTRRRSSHKRPREKEPRVVADPLHTASRLLARA